MRPAGRPSASSHHVYQRTNSLSARRDATYSAALYMRRKRRSRTSTFERVGSLSPWSIRSSGAVSPIQERRSWAARVAGRSGAALHSRGSTVTRGSLNKLSKGAYSDGGRGGYASRERPAEDETADASRRIRLSPSS